MTRYGLELGGEQSDITNGIRYSLSRDLIMFGMSGT